MFAVGQLKPEREKAHKTLRKNMQQEATQELIERKGS